MPRNLVRMANDAAFVVLGRVVGRSSCSLIHLLLLAAGQRRIVSSRSGGGEMLGVARRSIVTGAGR